MWLEGNNRPGLDNSMHAVMMRREQEREEAAAVVEQAAQTEKEEEEEVRACVCVGARVCVGGGGVTACEVCVCEGSGEGLRGAGGVVGEGGGFRSGRCGERSACPRVVATRAHAPVRAVTYPGEGSVGEGSWEGSWERGSWENGRL